jgi:altronate dehydratase
MCAHRLNELAANQEGGLSRFIALPHTEGCGASTQDEFIDIMLGYTIHPMVESCLLLEHGCEKTHNAFWQNQMRQAGLEPADFGWASIQLDGGIQPVMAKITAWFRNSMAASNPARRITAGLGDVSLGVVSDGRLSDQMAGSVALLIRRIVSAGGRVVLPERDGLLDQPAFWSSFSPGAFPEPNLGYARRPAEAGLYIMQRPSIHWSETLAGLGATGIGIVLALVTKRPLPGHPFIPVLQTAEEAAASLPDVDIVLRNSSSSSSWADYLQERMLECLSGRYSPIQSRNDNVDFQITRGVLGVSL